MNPTRDFTARTIKALAKLGIAIVGSVQLSADAGDTGYSLNDNGTYRIMRHRDILALVS